MPMFYFSSDLSHIKCKNNKSVQITYEKLKDELREKYLDKSKTPSEVSIVSEKRVSGTKSKLFLDLS